MKRTENALIVTGIGKYIADKEMRRVTPFRITNGKGYYVYKGKLIEPAEFYKLFPMELKKINYKGENRNKKLGWQNGDKSF